MTLESGGLREKAKMKKRENFTFTLIILQKHQYRKNDLDKTARES